MPRMTLRSCAASPARSKTRNSSYHAAIYLFPFRKKNMRTNNLSYLHETKSNERTDEHALTHKSAHLTTRVDRKPFTQDKFQLVRRQQHLVPISISILVLVVVVAIISIIIVAVLAADVHVHVHVRARARACAVRAPLKDRFGTEIMNDKVGRL